MTRYSRTFILTPKQAGIMRAFGHELTCHKCGGELKLVQACTRRGAHHYHYACRPYKTGAAQRS